MSQPAIVTADAVPDAQPPSIPGTGAALEAGPASEPKAAPEAEAARAPDALVEQELLVEEVSIDGMCGVY